MRVFFVCVAALALMACPEGKDAKSGTKPGDTSLNERGLTAEVSAVSLANDCAAPGASGVAGDCAEGQDCSLPCQQTSLQMSFKSDGPTEPVAVKILEVRLLAKATGRLVDTLRARAPFQWSDGKGYEIWDEQLPPNVDLKVKYDLDAPNWAEIGQSTTTLFYLEVDVEIDGTAITVESGDLSREPEIVT